MKETPMANKIEPFYNVDLAVGPHAPNKQTDVLLVQYFLKKIYADQPFRARKSPNTLKLDGRFGPILQSFIVDFQTIYRQSGGYVHVDGRVDPMRGSRPYHDKSSITKTHYTIAKLNGSFRKRHRAAHNQLELQADLPPVLAAELQVTSVDY
jgi:hypothetical protein